MSARGWALVCYDIRDDKRLRRVAKLLEGYGERLQYSVFRVRLSTTEEEKLRWKLTQTTKPEDSWVIIPLCGSCAERLRRRDVRAVWGEDPPEHVVV
ncbi:MAG: CRISPR-associated endonuclease Cas2 [Dehalococcoidia bacterium]